MRNGYLAPRGSGELGDRIVMFFGWEDLPANKDTHDIEQLHRSVILLHKKMQC